jgi:hypothetical protein
LTESAVSAPVEVAEPTPTGRRWREQLSQALFPASTIRVTWLEGALVVLIGWAVAYFRVGWSAGLRGTVWAEDGSVFLTQALTRGRLHSFFTEYAGYFHFAPRVIAGAIVTLPLAWQGIAMGLAAGLVQALMALVGYVASRPYVPWRPARAALALTVVAVPVGPETTDSVANLQWWLLFGAGIALLWTPLSRTGWICMAGLLFVTCGSSPLAVLPFALAVGRALMQRRRATLFVAAASAVAFAVQTMIMVSAPKRTGSQTVYTTIYPQRISSGYVRRIVGDGVLGWRRLVGQWVALGITTGLLIAAAVLALIVLLISRGRGRALVPVGGLIVMSMAVYATEAVLTGTAGVRPVGSDRYFVTPALFFCAALAAVLSLTVAEVLAERTVATVVAGAIAVTLVACQVYGIVTSWHTGGQYRREEGPGWSAGIRAAKQTCQGRPDTYPVDIPLSPANRRHWHAALYCGIVRSG